MASQTASARRKPQNASSNPPAKRGRKPSLRVQAQAGVAKPAKRAYRKRGRPRLHQAQTQEQPDVQHDDTTGNSAKTAEETTGTSYFESHRGNVRTSNLTLASLNILPAAVLEKARQELVDPLEKEQEELHEALRGRFEEFDYFVCAGHSLLFYGYGSKKRILDEFAMHQTKFGDVVVVNGFNPTVSLRSVLQQLCGEVLQVQCGHSRRTLLDYVDGIRQGKKQHTVTVVVHNIDGPGLRSVEAQSALASLGQVENIRLVASIDHMNAPLLWDGGMYSEFGWMWIKADTFVGYDVETVFCSKALLRGGEERQVEGGIALLKSLSERARKVFRELAKRQTGGAALREGDDREGNEDMRGSQTGTTFNELFESCKEQFLASDAASLQMILTELQTHHVLETRRGADAASRLWIPLQLSQLRDILKAIECT